MKSFNRLKMYFGRPFDVGNGMTVNIPTIGDILNLEDGDTTFYQTLNIWVGNPTMYRLPLWDMGVDWNKISDYQLFLSLYKTSNPDVTKLLFGDVKVEQFELYTLNMPDVDEDGNEIINENIILYNPELDISISEEDYTLISNYLKTAFNIFPKVEKAKGRLTKEAIIDEERMNLANRKNKETQDSPLLPLVSACINHPGFKYNLEQLVNVNFVQFMEVEMKNIQKVLKIYQKNIKL